jgi:hypothetical protein
MTINQTPEILRHTDPLLGASVDALGMPDARFVLPLNNITKGFFGVALATAGVVGIAQKAAADYYCGPFDDYYKTEETLNENGSLKTVYVCANATTTTTTSPPPPVVNQAPSPPGQSNGSSNNTRPIAPPTTINLDVDGDTFLKDQGFLPDVDDNSFGLGEEGAIEARSRGIDVDSGTEEANRNLLIAYTVNPQQWDQVIANFAFYGVDVMATTTTTTTTTTTVPITTASSTTTEVLASSSTIATSTTNAVPETTGSQQSVSGTEDAEEPTTTTTEAAVESNSDNSNDSSAVLWYSFGGLAGGLALVGIAMARRKEQKNPDLAAEV